MDRPPTNSAKGDRSRRTLLVLAAAIVLALVVFGLGALSRPSRDVPVRDSEGTFDASLPLQAAREALQSGDTSKAVSLASAVLRRDPGNRQAQAILSEASRARENGADPPSSGTTEPVQADAFDREVDDVGALLPVEFDGYDMSFVAAVGRTADVSGMPRRPGTGAFRIAWGVRDRRSAAGARDYIKKTNRVLYPKSSDEDVSIDGAVGYFGTDGRDLACMVYTRGRFVFEVVVVAETSGKPQRLKSLSLEAARAFPDAPPAKP